jgi:RimJ/RimL family protein N-acetyltransferase
MDDADGIARVLTTVVSERVHSAIDRAWTADQQRSYLASLSGREVFHVAMDASGHLIGYQSLDLYSPILPSMAHVGQLGTFLLPPWRGRGVGRALFDATLQFAAGAGYRKLVIQVRASNVSAQTFYRRLGFIECGRLHAQVVIDGGEDDEIVMERFVVDLQESAFLPDANVTGQQSLAAPGTDAPDVARRTGDRPPRGRRRRPARRREPPARARGRRAGSAD